MQKFLTLLSLATSLSLANAQTADSASPIAQDLSQPPAPIVRSYRPGGSRMHSQLRQPIQTVESQPIAGVWLRSEATANLTTVSATPQRTEIRLDHGRLNVTVHQPAQHAEILIDLPGGQTSLLKDGLYTFNADTSTVRVLHGEAAYLGPATANADMKPIKIKEDHQLSLVATAGARSAELKSVESYPYEITADLLPLASAGDQGYGGPDFPRYAEVYPTYYYAGFYGYPGYGYGYGYPFTYGIGFGYYRGFGGHYRGGFRR